MTAKSDERRRAKRRPILDTFSLFVVVPRKGPNRLPVQDVSELGIGFGLDVDGEPELGFKVASGETMEILFYLNQSLSIPLKVKVARVVNHGSLRRVGAEFLETDQKPYRAFSGFLTALDHLADVAQTLPF